MGLKTQGQKAKEYQARDQPGDELREVVQDCHSQEKLRAATTLPMKYYRRLGQHAVHREKKGLQRKSLKPSANYLITFGTSPISKQLIQAGVRAGDGFYDCFAIFHINHEISGSLPQRGYWQFHLLIDVTLQKARSILGVESLLG